ncbi:Ig-like domain-containing protein [Halofilum ochraceum]|uniref:Ig-like domain-containing protein n=1 Tax=Halofilum ochraceum TaxID=1611323 RepID=UPI0009F600F9|nr:Ig-like domain-containing protein [Halofilum ochraceum]
MLAVTTACIDDSSGDESTSGSSGGSATGDTSTGQSSTDDSSTDDSSTDDSSTDDSSTDDSSTDDSSTDDSSTDDSSADDSSTDDSASSVEIDVSFSPEDQSSGVSNSRTVSFQTSKALDSSSVDSDSFTLEGPDGEVSGDVTYSGNTAELVPASDLTPGANYTMTVTTDVMTEDGVSIANNHYASFTTVSASALPPKIDQWEQKMVDYGHQWGQELQQETDYVTKFKLRYYDAQRVHEQIGDYLGETQPWRSYGQEAESVYKQYLENADFRAAGWERFPHGLYMDWKRTGDTESRDYLELLRDRPPFSYPTGWEDQWAEQRYSREIAYSIESQIMAERAGYPRKSDRLATLVDLALGHIDIWVTKNYINSNPDWQFVQAFMTGLTGSALIEYQERQVERGTPDSRILPAIERVASFIWDEMWVANVNGTGYGAFEYVQPTTSGVGSESPAPDLNQLIAPMFAWLYLKTGDGKWLERGDDIFAGGVELADLGAAKRFNQNYRASFQFVEWRTEAVEQHGAQ